MPVGFGGQFLLSNNSKKRWHPLKEDVFSKKEEIK